MGASRGALGLLLCVSVLSACGEEKKASSAPGGTGGGGTAGSTGNSQEDSGVPTDAGSDAGSDASGPMVAIECEIEGGSVLSFDARRSPDGAAFAAAIQGNTTHLVVATTACGSAGQSLSYVTFETTGDPSEFKRVVNTFDECWYAREPVVLASDTGPTWLYFSANPNGIYPSLELHRKNLLTADGPELLGNDTENQLALSGAQLNAGDLPFFVYSNSSSLTRDPTAASIGSRRVGKIESLLVEAAAGFHASQTAVGSYGRDGQTSLGVVAWLSDLESSTGVYLRTTDEDGKAAGEIVQLTGDVETEVLGGAGNVDVAGQAIGGAVVYTVAPAAFQQIRFRAISDEGEVGKRVNLTSGQQNVRDAAIAPYARGYVVAYRRVEGQAGIMGSMELMFVDDAGRLAGVRTVGEASSDGIGADVFVANDGRIILIWVDNEGEGTKVRAARLKCTN